MKNINIEDVLNRIEGILSIRKETKKSLAEAVGIRYQSFVDWKTRGTIPAADITYRIAKHLGVSMEYLLTGDDDLPDDLAIALSYLYELETDEKKLILAMLKGIYDSHNPSKE